jgi:predicted nucleotidyltransferase
LYDALLQEIVDEAHRQDDILGILLTGSVARGDALPGSDLDLRFILSPEYSREFQSQFHQGILVEKGYTDLAQAQLKLETNPMEVYAYLDGRILYDPVAILAQLRTQAQTYFETYQVPEKEQHAIAYWLMTARLKMETALAADDRLKAAFITTTTSWKILEGLWAINDRPVPPSGAVWFHLKDLSVKPPQMEELLTSLFCAETQQRIQIALDLISWVLSHLDWSSIEPATS